LNLRAYTWNVITFGNQASKVTTVGVTQGANRLWHASTEQGAMNGASPHETQIAHVLGQSTREAIGCEKQEANM
jgi:hypothetical protein